VATGLTLHQGGQDVPGKKLQAIVPVTDRSS
jgi:hypothetical protein